MPTAKNQLTLSGTAARADPLIKDDKNRNKSVYQKVVNKYWALNSHKGFTKQVTQEKVNELWKSIKDTKQEFNRYWSYQNQG